MLEGSGLAVRHDAAQHSHRPASELWRSVTRTSNNTPRTKLHKPPVEQRVGLGEGRRETQGAIRTTRPVLSFNVDVACSVALRRNMVQYVKLRCFNSQEK